MIDQTAAAVDVSVVIPALNEEGTLITLANAIDETMKSLNQDYEIIFIDDGSTDSSWQIMAELSRTRSTVRAIRFRRNLGKALALSTGINAARGAVIITMDADLQDDPKEIPRFLAGLNDGLDLVSGWKRNRLDPWHKTVPSKLFNFVTSKVSGVRLRDFNCGFKAYRAEVFRSVNLYGELHRYIPVLAHSAGFKIGEIAVEHHPRRHGVSKYGLERFTRGLLDLLTVVTVTRYSHRPGHLFGGIGIALGLFSTAILGYLFGIWLFAGESIGHRPLLSLGVMTGVIAVQLVCFGMLAELIVAKGPRAAPDGLVVERLPKAE